MTCDYMARHYQQKSLVDEKNIQFVSMNYSVISALMTFHSCRRPVSPLGVLDHSQMLEATEAGRTREEGIRIECMK